jgi:structural maintenance of chromosome 3 (chondroitin sulfate proteoglycan 6)
MRQGDADQAQEEITKSEIKLEALLAKRGRKTQFKTKSERDKWIREELTRNHELLVSNEEEIRRLQQEHQKLARIIESAPTATQTDRSLLDSILKQRGVAVARRDQLNNERRRMWQQINEKDTAVRRLSNDYERARQQMERLTRHDIRQGLQSLTESLHEIGDENLAKAVHGQLIELMDVEPQYLNAVEVTAGNALFNVVVESFAVSARLLDHMNKKKKPGRVTFFPLDTCKSTAKHIPNTSNYSALLSHIRYEDRFQSVFAELFGKTVVVDTLDIAGSLVVELQCDAVTIDGDQFSRKGGITGGYFDKRRLKLGAFYELKELAEKGGKKRP